MRAGCGGELRRMAGRLRHQFRLSFGMALGMVPLCLLLPPPLAAVAAFGAWIALYRPAYADEEGVTTGWSWLCGFIAPLAMALGFADYAAAQFGPVARGLGVEEARLHPAAAGFAFDAAAVRLEFITSQDVSSSSGKSGTRTVRTFTVAPLTAPDWRPGDPVPAWVGCADDGYRNWRGGNLAALAAPWIDLSGLATAAKTAERRHGLASQPGAPMLELFPSLAAGRWQRASKLLTVVLAGYLGWAIPVVIGGLWGATEGLIRAIRAG